MDILASLAEECFLLISDDLTVLETIPLGKL